MRSVEDARSGEVEVKAEVKVDVSTGVVLASAVLGEDGFGVVVEVVVDGTVLVDGGFEDPVDVIVLVRSDVKVIVLIVDVGIKVVVEAKVDVSKEVDDSGTVVEVIVLVGSAVVVDCTVLGEDGFGVVLVVIVLVGSADVVGVIVLVAEIDVILDLVVGVTVLVGFAVVVDCTVLGGDRVEVVMDVVEVEVAEPLPTPPCSKPLSHLLRQKNRPLLNSLNRFISKSLIKRTVLHTSIRIRPFPELFRMS